MSATPDHDGPLSIEVRRGTPTDEELAAVIAVVSGAYSSEVGSATVEERRTDAWQRSARGLRAPLDRGSVWGRFSGS